MTYYRDLSKYEYHNVEAHTINIGWLDNSIDYARGEVPEEFINKLWGYLKYNIVQLRGFHECNLCSEKTGYLSVERNGEQLKLGSAEIRVLGNDGKIYAAPNLIYHYITKHNYMPPAEFIKAVLTGSSDSPEYINYIQKEFDGMIKKEEPKNCKKKFSWRFWKSY